MNDVTVRAPAKVNLGLSVGPPGDDGYHELVNVFHAVSIFDEVTARPADDFSVVLEPADQPACLGTPSTLTDVPLSEGNLAVRAARLLAEHTGADDGVELRLRKSIPVAGGMAGGSADAAAALVACDALWKTGVRHEALLELAAYLGSDVAFPLVGGTAVGHGRGERLTPVTAEGGLHWVFALAEGGLSAGAVYSECDRLRGHSAGPRTPERLLSALCTGDPTAIGPVLHNELQPAALSLRPDLWRTLEAGREGGALGALVSGSGPTCAFLAASSGHAAELAATLEGAGACRSARIAYGPVSGAHIADASLQPGGGSSLS